MELEQAVTITDKIRTKLANTLPSIDAGIPRITFSAGVATMEAEEDIEAALNRADKLMYTAKDKGRDRIEF